MMNRPPVGRFKHEWGWLRHAATIGVQAAPSGDAFNQPAGRSSGLGLGRSIRQVMLMKAQAGVCLAIRHSDPACRSRDIAMLV